MHTPQRINGSSLKNRSVSGLKLRRHTITRNEIKSHAITSSELRDTYLRGSDPIRTGDVTGTYAAPRVAQPVTFQVAANPLMPAGPDPCSQGRTAIFCGTANQFGSARFWKNYGPPFGPVSFWRDPYGLVHLSGNAYNGFAITSTVFILPTGFRPQHEVQFPVARHKMNCNTSPCDTTEGVIQVDANGEVSDPVGSDQDVGSSLDGITFSVR